jgi:predicted ATPase
VVFQRGTPPDAVYSFKHALVQDAAHGSLLRGARQQLHAQIAEALETHSPEIMENQPELLAQHYAEAGRIEESVAYWAKAGHRSAARSAMAEAVTQLQKGLHQLALLPDGHSRQGAELKFWSDLGAVLQAAKGVAAPETGHAYARARDLWMRLGSPSEYLQIPYGQSRYHAFRGELDLAQRLDDDLLHLSSPGADSTRLVLGHTSSGRNLMFAGSFAPSRTHLEEVLALHDPNVHRSLVHQIGIHPQVVARGFLGIVLFCLGFPDRALAQTSAAIAEAQRLAHPASLASNLTLGAILLSLVGDDIFLGQRADQLVAVTSEHGFPLWHALGIIHGGWVKAKNGDVGSGRYLLRSGSIAFRDTGTKVLMSYQMTLHAGACELARQNEEAAALLDDALRIVEKTQDRWFAAEVYRRNGQLLLRQGHSEAAEELYIKALGIAREQEAKLWE